MSEIITINIGGYGTRVGAQLLSKMNQENLNSSIEEKQSKLSVFYNQNQKLKEPTPRVIFLDTDKRLESYIKPKNFNLDDKAIACLNSSCRGLFPQGKYLMGADMSNTIEEILCKQVQKCDRLSGFILNCSLGGGCGSGLGALCLEKLRESYCYGMVQCFNLIPEYEETPMNHLQTYNTVLTYHQHVQYSNLDILLDNKALENYHLAKKQEQPTFDQLNSRVVDGILAHATPYWHNGALNTNQRKKITNLIPFPRLKNMLAGLSEANTANYIESSFKLINRFNRIQNYGRVYTSYVDIQDPFGYEAQIYESLISQVNKYGEIAEWIPGRLGISITDKTKEGHGSSAWNLINCSKSVEFMKKLGEQFTTQFRRKAFISHYIQCGMDQMEFTEAESNCNDLISQYVPCIHCYDDNDYYDEEESES